MMHHSVDQATGKGIAAAHAIQDIGGIQLAFERVPLVPEECLQAVRSVGVRIAYMAGNAFDVGIRDYGVSLKYLPADLML